MEILAILLVVLIVSAIANGIEAKARIQQDVVVKEIKKVCPPHAWYYQEIQDHEGVTHAWKLVCKHCGPLKAIDAPKKMDY